MGYHDIRDQASIHDKDGVATPLKRIIAHEAAIRRPFGSSIVGRLVNIMTREVTDLISQQY